MRICVVGTGAMGGLIGGRLALAGEQVTLVEREPRLGMIRQSGLTLLRGTTTEQTRAFTITDSLSDAGPQDVIVLAVKANDVAGVAPGLSSLFGRHTCLVTIQNGIPWWYFHRHAGPFADRRIEMLDPDRTIEANIDAARIVGCVAYPAAEVVGPGVIRHVEGDRLPVGELDGSGSSRVQQVADLFIRAGFRSRVITDIRAEIWLKAWGSLSFNPLSALTRATLEEICRFPETRRLAAAMMEEAQEIAAVLGITFRRTIEQRIAGAEKVGAHKTSMLQDLEAGRSLEIEALVGAVMELGRLTGIQTPCIDSVFAAVRLLARTSLPGVREEGVRVRPMRPADVPAACEVLQKWNMAPTPERADAERSELVVGNSFVAEFDSTVLGVASFLILDEHTAETASLAVDPVLRGRGVGYRLQLARLQEMWSRGIRRVRTETDRPETIRWYIEKFGYRKVGTNPKKHAFSLAGVDEWTVLELELDSNPTDTRSR